MSNIYDKASLVLIPSGTKTSKVYSQKPVNGDGDFTFSRSTAATRVNADGNIEKETQNLLLQSNSFPTASWDVSSVTLTGSQSGYDGSSDAWKLESNVTNAHIFQNISTSGVSTFSVYAKAGNASWIRLRYDNASTTDVNLWCNLTDGSLGVDNGVSSYTENIGGGWYRIVVQANTNDLNNLRIYPATSNGVNANAGDNIYIQDAQLEQGLVARDYIETTTAAVEGGITDNLPRLDYTDSSCPALLLEPQRTNLFDHSEYLDAWIKSNISLTSNAAISPEGVQNATTIDVVSATSFASIRRNISVSANSTYTMSLFVKKETSETNYMGLGFVYSGGATDVGYVIIDSVNGTAVSADPRIDVITNVVDFGDYWRIEATATDSGSNTSLAVYIYATLSINGTSVAVGTGSTRTIYGLQLEAGSYATSYIPCMGTSVTRTADNTIIDPSSLVGATQGSWFFELDDLSFEVTGTSVPTNWIGYNVSNCLAIEGRAAGQTKNIYFVKEESNIVTTLATKQISTTLKACFVWNGTSLKCFVDGVKVYDVGGFTQPIAWGTFEFNSNGREAQQTLKQTLLFPTAITNQEAIDLTT